MRAMTTYRMAAVVATCVALGACTKKDDTAAAGDSAAMRDSTSAMAAAGMPNDTMGAHTNTGPMSDPQIFGMMSASDSGELKLSRLAQTKATHPQVKAFARKMVTEHTAMLKQGSALAKRLTVVPAAPEDSNLVKDVADDIEDLTKKNAGKDWDDDYLDKIGNAHKKTLDFIDKAMNNATHADLKAALTKARPAVDGHLNEINQLKDRKTD